MGRLRALAVVPARLGSQRLPDKVLLDLGGKPVVVHTLERVRQARHVTRTVLATSDERVARVGEAHGFEVAWTTDRPVNGTERTWEAASGSDEPWVVNVQADEVLVDPQTIDLVIEALEHTDIATAAAPLAEGADDPHVVKVVCRLDGRALYFSRSRIPSQGPVLQHIGVYGFRREILERCAGLGPTPLEGAERLEQLRWIEAGFDIAVVQVLNPTPAVNTTRDLERIRVLWPDPPPRRPPWPAPGGSESMRKKFIFVTGGVLSSLGKGLSSASIGTLLEARGLRVTNVKMDPYINVDPGTMSPYQHGEVFVTEDGAETDLDLGHYERFTNSVSSQRNNFTTGRIYRNVIERERKGEYLGRTVQVIPHITDEIKRLIWDAVNDADIGIVEVGGTVGDIESLPFLEAIRQFRLDAGPENCLYIHLTLVPFIKTSGELKTKPTQHSVKELREIGIQPDILLCRAETEIPKDLKEKIGLFCNLDVAFVITAQDVQSIYELPLHFHDQDLDDRILEKLNIWAAEPHLEKWRAMIDRWKNARSTAKIAIVGKYVHLADTYKSLNEALHHGGNANWTRVELKFIDSESLDGKHLEDVLGECDAVLVPGGFGERGVEGKIAAIRWARENGVPFFGICLGLQLAVVEFARTVLGLTDANSREFTQSIEHTVIELMDAQRNVTDKGGTMRLGSWPCTLEEGSLAHRVYRSVAINERHRHRYEVNPAYFDALEAAGLQISGRSPDGKLAEMVEIKNHPYFIGCQFHPEFKSRPLEPHPLFAAFVKAALEHRARREAGEGKDPQDKAVLTTGPEAMA